jgi:hypothetical protein
VLKRRFVCSLDELPPGAMKLVDVGKFGVGVYNVRTGCSAPATGRSFGALGTIGNSTSPRDAISLTRSDESAPTKSTSATARCF